MQLQSQLPHHQRVSFVLLPCAMTERARPRRCFKQLQAGLDPTLVLSCQEGPAERKGFTGEVLIYCAGDNAM